MMIAVKEVDYKISDNINLFEELYGITPAINNKLNEMYDKVQKKKRH